jgi:hypothetical protein
MYQQLSRPVHGLIIAWERGGLGHGFIQESKTLKAKTQNNSDFTVIKVTEFHAR